MKLSKAMKRAILRIGPRRRPMRFDTLQALRRRGLIRRTTITRWVLTPSGVDIFLQLEKEEKGENQ